VNNGKQKGIALITALLILLLISSIIIGLSWMVMTDNRLGGSNADRQNAFYGAEAGMEKMTADLGELYGATNALSVANINTAMAEPPIIPGISYVNAAGASTYIITYTPNAANGGNPTAVNETISSPSPFAGLNGLITPFTLTVTARTVTGSESKLIRTVQAVGIPVFQFGIFSQTDLSYFPGPVFNFGGRVHTNANLWLASGASLTLSDKVTAVGDILVGNLANGYQTYWYPGSANQQTPQTDTCQSGWSGTAPSTSNPYPGQIMVDTIPYSSCFQLEQGTVTGASVTGGISTAVNTNWVSLSTGTFNSDILGGKSENVPSLNLSIAAPAVGGTPIDLVERPVPGENSELTAERYYTLSSVNILLDDTSALLTGTPNACGTPVDLSTLAVDSSGEYTSYPGWYTGGPEGKLPLPTSGAASTNYSTTDGYWIKPHWPIITGYILINLHTSAGACTDVTHEILNLGFIGPNLNPLSNAQVNGTPKSGSTGAVAATVPAGSVSTLAGLGSGSPITSSWPCATFPSANAVIRLARLRDNPASVYSPYGAGGCGWPYPSSLTSGPVGTDFWPNVIFDTREAVSRDNAPPNVNSVLSPNGSLTESGVMHYVELDVANLDKWFLGSIGSTGKTASNNTGYTVYFSDRRGEGNDPTLGRKSGSFGYNDIVNPSDAGNGCPNGTLDLGEDLAQTGVLSVYGGVPLQLRDDTGGGVPGTGNPTGTTATGTTLGGGTYAPGPALLPDTSDGTCSALGETWPGVEITQAAEAMENPPLFFRHALKVIHGGTITLGTCNTVLCGLSIAAENPVYLQGDYNSPTNGAYNASAASPGTSIDADAVTLLSDAWNDRNSFAFPYSPGDRPGAGGTTYRTAIIAGKGVQFPQVSGTQQDYGTDGGVHNFLRYLEGWGGTLYYEGSIVSFYYNQQAVGIYKCCNIVYGPPTRNYQFDTNFLTPSLLPPATPMLRDVNNVGFTQVVSPAE
jgi:hypothetical protein